MKKILNLRLLAAVFLGVFVMLAGCASNPVEEGDTPPVLTPVIEALALRLASANLDSGAFDWRQNDFPYVTTGSGAQNVTGITALGLADAFEFFPAELPAVGPVLQNTAGYLVSVMQDHLDGLVTSVSLPNYIYMESFRDVVGLPAADWNVVTSSFAKIINDRNLTYGDTAEVKSDGLWNWIYDARAGSPGIRGWDLAFLYKALVSMGWAQTEIDWVFAKLVALPIVPTDDYTETSVAHVVEVCALHGAKSQGAAWRAALDGFLTIETTGMSIGSGRAATAYAVMALDAWGDLADAGLLLDWLELEVGTDGSLYSSDDYEYFEIMGEVLQALLLR